MRDRFRSVAIETQNREISHFRRRGWKRQQRKQEGFVVRRSWFVVVAVAAVFACLRCLHAQRGCTLSLVQQGREAGWVVRLKETEKARLAPLAWPATRKEAWQACQRFLDGKKRSKQQRSSGDRNIGPSGHREIEKKR